MPTRQNLKGGLEEIFGYPHKRMQELFIYVFVDLRSTLLTYAYIRVYVLLYVQCVSMLIAVALRERYVNNDSLTEIPP